MTEVLIPSLVSSPNTIKSPIAVLRDIIVHEMGLDGERVNIYNQKFKIPPDDEIFVVLSFIGAKPFRVRNTTSGSGNSMQESQTLNVHEIYEINILSRNESAMFRKEEILFALVSQYAEQQQELNNFKIFRMPASFNDVSEVEAAARLYRFSINIVVFAWYTKTPKVIASNDYYDKFNGVVYTDYLIYNSVYNSVAFVQPVPTP